jgi:hypothetical protein
MPDVSFIRADRLPQTGLWEGTVPIPPDLATRAPHQTTRPPRFAVALNAISGPASEWSGSSGRAAAPSRSSVPASPRSN